MSSPGSAPTRSRVTTHVLDATSGRPAAGVRVKLQRQTPVTWNTLAEATTDADGRVSDFGPADLDSGVYRVWFDTGAYFSALDQAAFYPEVALTFEIVDPDQHYHVPLLLSPFAFSTYRGS